MEYSSYQPLLNKVRESNPNNPYLPQFAEWVGRILYGLESPTPKEFQVKFFSAQASFGDSFELCKIKDKLENEYSEMMASKYTIIHRLGTVRSDESFIRINKECEYLVIRPVIEDKLLMSHLEGCVERYINLNQDVNPETVKFMIKSYYNPPKPMY